MAGSRCLYGNIAADGCIVKTAGVDESCLKFSGPAVICESQEEAVAKILGGGVKAGDVQAAGRNGMATNCRAVH